MTKDELKQAIDNYLGMTSQLEVDRLVYYSPTHIKLFDFIIGDYGNGWEVGGNSGIAYETKRVINIIHYK